MPANKVTLDVAAFLDSAEARALACSRADLQAIAERLVGACYDDLGKKPSKLDGEDVRTLLVQSLPARLKAKDPLAPHVPEVFAAFLDHLETVEVVSQSFEARQALAASSDAFYERVSAGDLAGRAASPAPDPFVHGARKLGRNDPCSCGSGKKFKKCHGKGT